MGWVAACVEGLKDSLGWEGLVFLQQQGPRLTRHLCCIGSWPISSSSGTRSVEKKGGADERTRDFGGMRLCGELRRYK